ncbi:MAG TPA: GNAT family N-acetyltransferase [Solirubrobacteraceae bacterium]|jgi:GNAT superfamily N-acetyltransferase|nr:GNAT family N-acetyltransferase [Solirubrobacteraceae bacterium]
MEVRRAVPADALPVAEVHVRAWRVAYAELLPPPELEKLDPRERATRYDFSAGAAQATFVAAEADAVLGFATCGARDGESGAGEGELRALYIDPPHWRTGLGRVLLRYAEDHMRGLGFQHAVLWVLLGNAAAERFYLAHGWRADDERRHERFWGVPVEVARYSREL